MGLSFFELNEMSFFDYLEFADMYIGKGSDKKNEAIEREATQDDIDRLLS